MGDKSIYEGVIGGYSFSMADDGKIEVWSDTTNEFPDSFIFVNGVNSQKDFDIEISSWYMKNVG